MTMDLATIEDRTGLELRRLRYVLEHRVLPGGRIGSEGRGIPRNFTDFEAFGIACAALLLKAGLRRRLVTQCLELLCTHKLGSRSHRAHPVFYDAWENADAGFLEVGDGVNVRISAEAEVGGRNVDSGWMQVSTGANLTDDYAATIRVSIDIGRLRQYLSGPTA